MMAYQALRIPSREVHEMANMMEDMEWLNGLMSISWL
jgi:hypothetical protein